MNSAMPVMALNKLGPIVANLRKNPKVMPVLAQENNWNTLVRALKAGKFDAIANVLEKLAITAA